MRPTRLLLTTAIAALAVPGVASAASATYDANGTLVVTAIPGDEDHIDVMDGHDDGEVILQYGGSTRPITFTSSRCEDPGAMYGFVVCEAPNGVRVLLGDRADRGVVSDDVDTAVHIDGGAGDDQLQSGEHGDSLAGGDGNDVFEAGAGDDVLDGGAGNDRLEARAGSDRLYGGPGEDVLTPDGGEPPSADVVDGGDGVDAIENDYTSRRFDAVPQPVAITLAGGADDGRVGEGDDLQRVEQITLSGAGGRVVGSDAAEYVKLHQVGRDGELVGLGGDDELRGGDGNDRIDGGAGADSLDGGFGDDTIVGGPGPDTISADLAGGDCGPAWCKLPYGDDVVDARDGARDSVTCGAGTDRVAADAVDVVAADCEAVEGRPQAAPGTSRPRGGSARGGRKAGATMTVSKARLGRALRRGLTVRLTGVRAGKVKVVARHGRRLVARGTGRASTAGKATVKLRFTRSARRSLARRRTVRLKLTAGAARATVTLMR